MVRSTVIVEGYALDLLEDISTDFTYSIADIREPDKRRTDFSKTIEIPGTARNNALFAHLFNVNVENDWTPDQPNIGYNFNPNKVAKAVVLVDNIEVFRGVLQVAKARIEDGRVTYETVVLGRLADILFAFGDKKLSDIDFSDMDHVLTVDELNPAENKVSLDDVWNNPQKYRYTYPLIDYGFSVNGIDYPIQNFAPAIYVKEYIDRMFEAAGFTYEAPFFSSPYFEALVIPTTTKYETGAPAADVKYLELATVVTTQTTGGSGLFQNDRWFIRMPFKTEIVDKYSWHAVNVEGDIVITKDIEVSFQFKLEFTYNNRKGKSSDIFVLLNDDHNNRLVVQTVQADTIFRGTIEIPKRFWSAGDKISIGVNLAARSTIRYYTTDCRWYAPSPKDDSQYPVDVGTQIRVVNTLSQGIAQKDFFKSILTMHNLYLFSDENNPNKLFITPQTWFYSTFAGDAVDWTYKAALDQEVEVIPMGELGAREYLFTYKSDTDEYNDRRYFKVYNEIYGQKKYTADNDFEKDTHKTELIFSPSPPVQEVGSTRVLPHYYKVDNEGVKERDAFNLRILLYGGLIASKKTNNQNSASAKWFVTDYYGTRVKGYDKYPYAGMWDNPVTPSRDLCFGPPKETFYFIDPYPDVGLFRYWWEPTILEITNKDSKLVRQWFWLTPSDINQLDFKRLVKVGDTYFKLNKIESYKPLGNALTLVELFKTVVKVEIERPGFLKWSDEGYLLHSDESPARIPYA